MTEAERIENDAEYFADDGAVIRLSQLWYNRKYGYIAGATAENERLQKQLEQQKYDNENAWKGVKQVCAEKYELQLEHERLQQLIKEKDELIQKINNLVCFVNDDKEKVDYIKSLINKAHEQ